MFCEHCGAELKEGSAFCEKCGTPVAAPAAESAAPETAAVPTVQPTEQYAQYNQYSAPAAQPVYAAPAPAPVKKKSKAGIIVAIVAVITALAVAAGVFLLPRVFKGDSKDQFSKLGKKSFQSFNASFGQEFSSLKDGFNIVAKLDISKELFSLLGASSGNQFNKDIDITADFTYNNNAQFILSAEAGGKEFLSANAVVDMLAQKAYLAVPGLLDGTFEMDVSDLLDEIMPNGSYDLVPSTGLPDEFTDVYKALPDSKTTEKLFNDYFDIFVNGLDEISSEKDTLTVGDLSEKCTVLTADVSKKEINDITLKILKKARDDKRISDIACAAYNISVSEYEEKVDDAIADLTDEDASSDKAVTVRFYANSKDELIGTEVIADEFSVTINRIATKDAWSIDYTIESDGRSLGIVGSGTINGKKQSGDISLKMDNKDLLIATLDDIEFKNANLFGRIDLKFGNGFFDYTDETVNPAIKAIVKTLAIRMDLKEPTGNVVDCADISVLMGDTRLFGIGFELKPAGNDVINVPVSGDYTDIEEWTVTLDFEKFYESFRDAGLPVDQWMGAFFGDMY